MTFIHNEQQYYDDSFAWHGGDVRYAIQLTKKYKKCAILEQASLNELVRGKSTVFKINAYHEQYKNPGANANPYGLLKWDSTIARKERLKEHDKHLKATTGLTIGEWATSNVVYGHLKQNILIYSRRYNAKTICI